MINVSLKMGEAYLDCSCKLRELAMEILEKEPERLVLAKEIMEQASTLIEQAEAYTHMAELEAMINKLK